MARSTSVSVSVGLPPCEGILRTPLSALVERPLKPRDASFDHAFLSPILGAPLAPVPWQATHTASTTSLPLRSTFCAGAVPGASHTINAKTSGNASCPGVAAYVTGVFARALRIMDVILVREREAPVSATRRCRTVACLLLAAPLSQRWEYQHLLSARPLAAAARTTADTSLSP